MPTEALAIGRLVGLLASAVPVSTRAGGAEDAWLTLQSNLAGATLPRSAEGIAWLAALETRKTSLLLPEYRARYHTQLITASPASYQCGSHASDCELAVFASLVRERFLCVSVWLWWSGDPEVPTPIHLSSALADPAGHISLPSSARGGKEPNFPASFPTEVPTVDAARRFRDLVLTLFGGHVSQRAPEGSDESHFDATLATLLNLPGAFATDSSQSDPRGEDWRLAVAALLPMVKSPPGDYHPRFLLDALGVDVMDSAFGRYFIGRRRILALLDDNAAEATPKLWPNTVTWTQLLSENASVQLAAIRAHAELLHSSVTRARSPAAAARALTQSHYSLYQDLDEAQNIAVSLDPIFWHHQETLKRISGLATLAENLRDRASALASASALDEQRRFAAAAQALATVVGAFTVAAPAVQIGVEAKARPVSLVLVALGAAVAGALLGWCLVWAIAALAQRRTSRGTDG